jgi:hypothetical protein
LKSIDELKRTPIKNLPTRASPIFTTYLLTTPFLSSASALPQIPQGNMQFLLSQWERNYVLDDMFQETIGDIQGVQKIAAIGNTKPKKVSEYHKNLISHVNLDLRDATKLIEGMALKLQQRHESVSSKFFNLCTEMSNLCSKITEAISISSGVVTDSDHFYAVVTKGAGLHDAVCSSGVVTNSDHFSMFCYTDFTTHYFQWNKDEKVRLFFVWGTCTSLPTPVYLQVHELDVDKVIKKNVEWDKKFIAFEPHMQLCTNSVYFDIKKRKIIIQKGDPINFRPNYTDKVAKALNQIDKITLTKKRNQNGGSSDKTLVDQLQEIKTTLGSVTKSTYIDDELTKKLAKLKQKMWSNGQKIQTYDNMKSQMANTRGWVEDAEEKLGAMLTTVQGHLSLPMFDHQTKLSINHLPCLKRLLFLWLID